MKTYSKFSLLTLCSLFALSASAQTIISSTTNNGSFEDGSGSAIDLWEPPINTGTVQEQRLSNNASDGTFSAVIGHGTQGGSKMNGVLLNTGHDVSAGETFNFSFDWIPLFNWTATDEMIWTLFTTSDDTAGGTISNIASGVIDGFAIGDGYQSIALNGIGTVAGANVGQDLWVEFDGGQFDNEFSRVDNVNLSVVPEPSVALFSLVGILALLRRRR